MAVDKFGITALQILSGKKSCKHQVGPREGPESSVQEVSANVAGTRQPSKLNRMAEQTFSEKAEVLNSLGFESQNYLSLLQIKLCHCIRLAQNFIP